MLASDQPRTAPPRTYPDLHEHLKALDDAARRAVAGDYFSYGETLIARRRSDVAMNTEVRELGG
jgi:hypothetical protein